MPSVQHSPAAAKGWTVFLFDPPAMTLPAEYRMLTGKV